MNHQSLLDAYGVDGETLGDNVAIVRKNDESCIQNEEFCIKNNEFFIKNEECCILKL